MEQILTELGAEIVSIQMEEVLNTTAIRLVIVFVIIGLVSFIVYAGLQLRSYVPFQSSTPKSIAISISFVSFAFCFLLITYAVFVPTQTDEIGCYVVRVSEDTDLTAIAKQFEVVGTENYPILTVRAKNKE